MGTLKVGRIVMGSVQTNCYFVYREGQQDVLFFDPADRGKYLYDKLTEHGFSVAAVLLTHAHFDHILGVEELCTLSGAPLYALDAEQTLCEDATHNVSAQVGRPCKLEPERYLRDGETFSAAGIDCQVIATPGHTIGSCCYYFAQDGILICGDTLFLESVGRTDLYSGDASALIRSVREKLFVLPDDTKVYPGHGDMTTIGHEKQYNPFCG